MQKLMLIGNLTKDAEVKEINGASAIVFTIAVNEKYTDKNGLKVDRAFYYDASLWKDNTNVVAYLKKGVKIFLEGVPSINIYQDKDGKAKGGIRIRVNYFQFLSSIKKDGQNQPEGNDDMPF